MSRHGLSLLWVIGVFLLPQLVKGQLPADFHEEVFLSGFEFPTGITFDSRGIMYVSEKAGKIHRVDTNGVRIPTPFIDISEEVTNWKDHGLMGFALDRDFLTNGYCYLLYAVDPYYLKHFGQPEYNSDSTIINSPTIGRITRFQADFLTGFSTIVPGSRTVLLGETIQTGLPLTWEFHGLGSLIVADDGTLLVSCGDGSSNLGPDTGGDALGTLASQSLAAGVLSPDQNIGSYRSQYLGSYNGKVLRIDPITGEGLPSNPFFDPENPRSPQSRTWLLGLRNPYRITLKPSTGSHWPQDGRPGTLLIGDVGNGSWEELNLADKGGLNFGWPFYEGYYWDWNFYIKPAPVNPMAPNPLYNINGCTQEYLTFRDLFALPAEDTLVRPMNPCDPSQPIPDSLPAFVQTMPVLSWSNSMWNPPIRAEALAFHEQGFPIGLQVVDSTSTIESENFGGYSSLGGLFYTGQSFPESYHNKYFAVDFAGWIKVIDFDENNQFRKIQAFHSLAKDIIHLAQHPKDGSLFYLNLGNEIRRISFGGNPAPKAVIESDKSFGPGPLSVHFSSQASSDELPITQYLWDFGDGQSSSEANPVHTFSTPSDGPLGYTVRLTVTDSLGASGTVQKIIGVNASPPQVNISSCFNGDRYPTDRGSLQMLQAEVTDQEDSPEALNYEWRAFLQHNEHVHPEPPQYTPEGFLLISPLGCGDENFAIRITLKVTDPSGLVGLDERILYPNCIDNPVDWLRLYAVPDAKTISLNWQIKMNSRVLWYEIQRGSDFFHFEPIGTLPVDETSIEDHFLYKDQLPLLGPNIYRIKAYGANQTYTYSNLVIVNFPDETPVKVYPNPAKTELYFETPIIGNAPAKIDLFDALGRKVLNFEWPQGGLTLQQEPLMVGHLSPGVYYYQLQQGGQRFVGKVIKE